MHVQSLKFSMMPTQVYSADGDTMHVKQVCTEVALGGEQPLALHGGAMLAVACQKSARIGGRPQHSFVPGSWQPVSAHENL